jgi:hypothetical protein
MACGITEGWITRALMYQIFSLPGSKFECAPKGSNMCKKCDFIGQSKKRVCILFSVMKINHMLYFSLIYFVNQPLHVSGMIISHHKDVFTVYVLQFVCVVRLTLCGP